MQNTYALDTINDIVSSITKYQTQKVNQQEYTIKKDQLNRINDIATKNKQVLTSMNNGYSLQLESEDYPNLKDLIQCYKVVTSQVHGYYNTNLYAKLGYKTRVNFWQKTKDVIRDAKMQTQLLKQQVKKLPQLQNLKKQANKLPLLRKQQLDAIKQMNNHLINGQLAEFKRKHSFKRTQVYNFQAKQYQLEEGYLLKYSISAQILEQISTQFLNIQKLEQKLKQILQVKQVQQNQFKKTIVGRCTYLAEQIKRNMKSQREELSKISKLEQIQKKIIMGSTFSNHFGHTNTEQKILAPVIQDYKLIKQAVDNLKGILNDPYWSDSKLSLGQSCKLLVENFQKQIREAADQLHRQIGSHSQGIVYSIGGLIKLISSYKSIMQNKIRNQSISNRSHSDQKQNHGISLTHHNSLNKSASEIDANDLILKMDEFKSEILNDIKSAGIISQEFKKKYTNFINPKNRTYADQIIIAVLQTTRLALQIPGNISLIDYITTLNKDKQYNEWMYTSQKVKNQKLQKMVWPQQNNNVVINRNHYKQQTQEQYTNEILNQNERLNQQINQLKYQKEQLDKQLLRKSKQFFDQQTKNKNLINQLQDQLKQRNNIIQQLTSQIDEKNEQFKKLSDASNMIASNSNNEKDQIISKLQSDCRYQIQRKQLSESQCHILNAQIGSVITRANQLFKEKQLNSITQVFQRCLKQINILWERRKFYKQKCLQNQTILKQFFKNIQQKVENTTVDRFSDVQNLIQSLNDQKIQISQKLMNNIQSIKSIQNILSKIAISQLYIQQNQNQTGPLSQYDKITKQIESKLNLLVQSNIRHKTIKFNDRSTILGNTKEEKFIVQELTNYLGDNSITRFNLLYRFSQGGNLAEAITAHPNTILIIKTNGVIIACYSSLSYCQIVDMKQRKGLLIETHTNSSYCLKPGNKPVEYDENNLIFGNKILKISKKERNHKMQIEFNQKNSIFENEKKHKLYDLFKSTDKQIQFEDFEIYQIQQKNNDTVKVQRKVSQSDPVRQSRIMNQTKAQERIQQAKTSVPKNNTSKGKVSIRELTQQVEKHKKGILTLKKQNEELKKKIQLLENAKVNDQKIKNNTITITNSSSRNTLTVPTGITRTTSNQSQQSQLQKQLDEMTKKMKNTEQSLLQKTHKLNQAQNKIKQQDQKIKQLIKQKQVTINQSVRKQKNDQLENVRKQKSQVQKKLSELEIEHNKIKEQVDKNTKQLQKIRNQLEDKKSQIQILQKQNQRIITGLREEKQKIIEQNQKLRQQNTQNTIKQEPKQTAGNEQNPLNNSGFHQQKKNFSHLKTNQSQQMNIKFASHISQQSATSIIKTESGFNMNEAYINKIKKQLQFQLKMFDYKIQPSNTSNADNQIIQKLKTQINQLKQAIQKQKQQKQQNERKAIREKQKLEGTIKINTSQLGEYYKKNQQLQKQIKKLKEGKGQLLQIPSSPMPSPSPTKSTQLNRTLNQKDNPKQLKKQVQENKKILNKIMESKNLIEKQCTQKQADLFKINQKHKKATQSLKELQDKVAKLKQQQQDIIKLMDQLQARKRQKEQLDYQIKQLKDQIKNLNKQIDDKREQIDRQKVQINKLKNQKQTIARQNKKMEQINNKIQQKTKQLEQVNEKLGKANADVNSIQQNIELLKKKQQQQRKAKELATKDHEQIQKAIIKISSQLNNLQKQKYKYGGFPNRLFIGQCLSEEQDREYIIQQVQKVHPKEKIVKSRLLYSYPLMRLLNPHQTVDGVQSYIIIMKLANKQAISKKNYTLAMYSEKPLIKGAPINNGLGFVSAVTKKSTFSIRNLPSMNPRLTQYNDYYFIFGNSQFRFRINSNKIQINVGHNFKSLDTGDLKTPELFAGTTETDIEIESYEIYQLYFDRKY